MAYEEGKNATYVVDNLRLQELVAVVDQNKDFFDAFVAFLVKQGYKDVFSFIEEKDAAKAKRVLTRYFNDRSRAKLFDGLGRAYPKTKAKWYFLAWLLRDAPAQRLGPLLQSHEGATPEEKRTNLIDHLRRFAGPLFPTANRWEWPAIAEVMIARLEGSRRALKGTRFEALVRALLIKVFTAHEIKLTVGDKQVTLHKETYDVQVKANSQTLLIPVKTRETMGGGHALLFTRDIFKSVNTAKENGYQCIPIVIAESWTGDLPALGCENLIYIQTNPNQLAVIEPVLEKAFVDLIPVWEILAHNP